MIKEIKEDDIDWCKNCKYASKYCYICKSTDKEQHYIPVDYINTVDYKKYAGYVGVGFLLIGIFIVALLIGLATGKPLKINKHSKLSSNHSVKTRQRRAMYANRFR